MKLTESQLRRIIREELSKVSLKESSSREDYEKLQSLSQYRVFFDLLDRLGREKYDEILLAKSEYERRDFYYAMQDLKLPSFMINKLWNSDPSEVSSSVIFKLKQEFDRLSGRFRTEEITDETDRAYGRKKYQIVDVDNNEVIKTFIDKKGSLGT